MIRAKNMKTFGAAPKVPQHKRRKPVEGEDLPALKAIMKDIEGQRITVEDFVLLVAPHTGDKGAALTKVMTLDINAFRKFVNEAYDTMSSDTSEVMAKTQMELSELYVEKHHVLTHSMIKCMKSIQDYIVDFDLQLYNQNPEQYLASHFKIADIPDSEEVEQARRQLAYHRLNWLKSEGDRLAIENTKLQKRLNELKKIQQGEIVETIRKEKEAEQQRIALEHQQEEMKNKLENLVEELHDTIVTEEENMTQSKIEVQKQTITKKLVKAKTKAVKTKESVWSIRAAQGIEKAKLKKTTASQSTLVQEATKKKSSGKVPATSQYAQAFSSTATTAQTTGKRTTGAKKKVTKTAPVIQRPEWQDVNLDEFASSSDAACPPACPGNAPPPSTYSGQYGQQASSSRAQQRQTLGSSQYKTGAKMKKTAAVIQRPEWQDVNLDEFASSSDAACLPACPGNAPPPSTYSGQYGQQASSSRAQQRQTLGSSQYKTGAKMKKTAAVIQRPEWQDVNLDEFASSSDGGCPPACPGNAPPPPTDGYPPSCP